MTMIPQLNSPELAKLIKLINPSLTPISVVVEPEEYAQENGCTLAVEEKIKRDGGSQILGWQVWISDFWIEAEFHSIWESPDGKLIDITPKMIPVLPNLLLPVSSIVFLPDPKIEYKGAQIDNIRLNITNNPLVDDIIEMFKAQFKLLNRGHRALEYEVVLNNKEADLLGEINIIQSSLYLMAEKGMNRWSECFCGSHKMYKDCCYNKIIKISKNGI